MTTSGRTQLASKKVSLTAVLLGNGRCADGTTAMLQPLRATEEPSTGEQTSNAVHTAHAAGKCTREASARRRTGWRMGVAQLSWAEYEVTFWLCTLRELPRLSAEPHFGLNHSIDDKKPATSSVAADIHYQQARHHHIFKTPSQELTVFETVKRRRPRCKPTGVGLPESRGGSPERRVRPAARI